MPVLQIFLFMIRQTARRFRRAHVFRGRLNVDEAAMHEAVGRLVSFLVS